MAVHGTRNRESVSWDYAGVLGVLKNVARDHTGLPLLRCYWYEATVDSRRSAEHDTLADLPGVKLRLGRMRPGHREGVESEIHRDLTTLARNRAISDALVVSAEEDLAQVIAEVQDLGVRVVLVHIGAPGWTAPAVLRQECDDIVEISAAHLRPSVELVVGAEPVSEDDRPTAYTTRAPANGHGPPGVIGQPQHPPAGSPAAPPAIYTGTVIAEYQRAAQPANSQPPSAANASGLGAGQSRPGENGLAGPSAMPGQHAAHGQHAAPGQHATAGQHAAPTQPVMPLTQPPTPPAQPPMPPGQSMLPPDQVTQGQPLAHASVPAPPPLPRRPPPARAGGGHAGPPSPPGESVPAAPGQHVQHAPPPHQLAPQPLAPGQPVPPPGQAAPGQPPGQAAPGQPMPAYQAAPPVPTAPPAAPGAPAQPGFRTEAPDVAAARQAAATPRPPTVGAPPGPALGPPPGAVPAAAPVPPGQPLQPGQPPRGYPAGMPGRVPSRPADQRARQFPGAPAQPDAGVTAPYVPQQGPHTGPQPAAQPALVPQPMAVALADTVQAAHGEGFSFGQAVARDAPALWLEAVLARKPRMPSDLEARLVQDSSLPIDSLLHDEVRHALRRGFWDALERVRR